LGVQEAVRLLSRQMSFETVAETTERLLGLSITAPVVEVLSETAGQRAERLETSGSVPPRSGITDTLIVAADGCQASQRDGWHEVKMAMIYPKESRLRRPQGRGRLWQKEYVATLDNAEGFGHRLRRRAEGWGVDRARRVVVMGDGAGCIWNLSDLHFPGATEIVDFYHALEHLWDTGEALWGNRDTSGASKGWVRYRRRRLKEGDVDAVLAGMERAVGRKAESLSQEARKTVALNLEHFRRNALRMRYGRSRQMGLPIGTGAVEGACKHVVQSRFKGVPAATNCGGAPLMRPGMRWAEAHAGVEDPTAQPTMGTPLAPSQSRMTAKTLMHPLNDRPRP
jgi:hypothetical protein